MQVCGWLLLTRGTRRSFPLKKFASSSSTQAPCTYSLSPVHSLQGEAFVLTASRSLSCLRELFTLMFCAAAQPLQ
ncbi:hypothetical protein EON66_07650 [archaeon]|nr:MAG: hypothetical protein EON66_07650 [archaeon]